VVTLVEQGYDVVLTIALTLGWIGEEVSSRRNAMARERDRPAGLAL
jgi:hypothetical protein